MPLAQYRIGDYVISENEQSPAELYGGVWERLPAGYALWTATSGASEKLNAGLPNITGTAQYIIFDAETGNIGGTGAIAVATTEKNYFNKTGTSLKFGSCRSLSFSAKNSNTIYGNSTTVQPPAYKVYVWKRIA